MRGRSGKALVPLLSILIVVLMVVAGTAIWFQTQEHDKRLTTEHELSIVKAEINEVKARLDETQQAKSRSETELTQLRQELTQTKDALTQAAASQDSLTHSVEDREKEINRLTKDLEQIRTQDKDIGTQLSELQRERETMKQQLADLERSKGDLETKVVALSDHPSVELDKVMVGGAQPAGSAATVLPVSATTKGSASGQIVVVNKEYDFIVMNLGKSQGLSIGQEFQVVRGDQVLGKVKVEKVYDELSAAAILPESKKDSIHEGDTVKAL